MVESLDILGMTVSALETGARERLASGSGVARRVYARAFRSGRLEPGAEGVSASSAAAWERAFRVGILKVISVVEEAGECGITSKALLEAGDGARFECVRVPMPIPSRRASRGTASPRATLCVSSQAGCRMACAFCATGNSGFVRDLSAAEIVSQAVTTRVMLGWECDSLVFMGSGEPLDNFDAVARAIAVLLDPAGLGMGQERITVCTSGLIPGIARLKGLGLKRLGLSVSLNAGDDETRTRLMPINRSGGLNALAAALRDYPQRGNFALGVNYCLLPGINDRRADASGVARFCQSVGRCMLNLIPYNPGPLPIARAPTEEEVARFEAWLRDEGVLVRRRAAKGATIMAACGQLASRPCVAGDPRRTIGPGGDYGVT